MTETTAGSTEAHDPIADRATRADRIRRDMGGAEKVAGLHAEGHKTIRDHLDGFLFLDRLVSRRDLVRRKHYK